MILVDTNIPLRIAQAGHAHRQIALDALELLTLRDQEQFAIAPQSLYEMYVVCTRPATVNGVGMTPEQALAELAAARALFQNLPDTPQIYSTWEGLMGKYKVQGKRAHDLRLAAFMIEHRIPTILTFNDADFRTVSEIDALNPFDILGVPRT